MADLSPTSFRHDPHPTTFSVTANTTAAIIAMHIETGRLQIALDTAVAALAVCTAQERVPILCMQCNALVTMGRPLEALRVATSAHELALAQGEPLLAAEAGLALAFALQSLEEHGRAIDVAANCERIARDQLDKELLARSMRTLAISYSVLGRHEQAIELLERVIPLLERYARTPERLFHARYSLITARSRLTSGNAAGAASDLSQYVALRDEWLNFARDVDARSLVRLKAMAMGNAGIAARYAGDHQLALEIQRQTLALQYEIGLRGHAAVMEGHFGATLRALGRTEEAINAFKRAIELFAGGNPRELAATLEELADAYEILDDPRSALAALKQARALERKLQDDAALVAATRMEQKAEIAQLSEHWTRLASEDSLTGLSNRRAFDGALHTLIEARQHESAHGNSMPRPFALVLFDLDHFKRVNDGHGHGVGDTVLRRFAGILREGRRAEDVVARVGGEEFALLMNNATLLQATAVAEKVLNRTRGEAWNEVAPALSISVSAGVACSAELTEKNCTTTTMVAYADRRLYRAKNSGRNCVINVDLNPV
jgi:diguanylate cyclase (GGDEF)-like protein